MGREPSPPARLHAQVKELAAERSQTLKGLVIYELRKAVEKARASTARAKADGPRGDDREEDEVTVNAGRLPLAGPVSRRGIILHDERESPPDQIGRGVSLGPDGQAWAVDLKVREASDTPS